MAAGGKRKGAGRPPSPINVRMRAIAKQIAERPTPPPVLAEGLSPLEILLANARHYQQTAQDAEKVLQELRDSPDMAELDPQQQFDRMLAEVTRAADLRKRADAAAALAAPYIHPRLAPAEAGKGSKADEVPLPDRLKTYAREKAIKASEGKVVEIRKPA